MANTIGELAGQTKYRCAATPSTALHSLTPDTAPSQSTEGDAKMIKKVKEGYKVLSEKGKNLGGPYKTKAEAEKRLKQVEYFKHRKA